MPTAEAQLIISCKATGQKVIDDFNKSMQKLDQQAEKTLKKLADVEKQLERMKSAGGNIAASGIGGNSTGTGRIGQRVYGLEDIRVKAKQIEDYITKTHGGISKSINGVDTQCKNLAKSATVATVATKKLSGSFISGKIAGRLFGFEVSNTSKELTQIAIIAKGIESAVKIAQFAGNKYLIEPFQDMLYQLQRNYGDASSIGTYETAKDQRFLSYFATLRRINEQEKISAVDRVKMNSTIEQITKSFKGYNFIIDETTGKIKNLTDLEVKFTEDSRQRAIKNTNRRILYLQEQQRELQEFISGQREVDKSIKDFMRKFTFGSQKNTLGRLMQGATSLIPGAGGILFGSGKTQDIDRRYEALANIFTGGNYSKNILEAGQKLSTVQDQLLSTKNILNDLLSQDPTKFLRALDLAKKADEMERLNTAFSKMLTGLKQQEKITRLIIAGKGTEAERLKLLYSYQSRLPGLSEAQYKQLTDQALLNQKLLTDQRAQAETASFLLDIQKQAYGLKQTAETAISANSLQGALLQSRQIITGEMSQIKKITEQQKQGLMRAEAGAQTRNTGNQTTGANMKNIETGIKTIISLLTAGNVNTGGIKTKFDTVNFSTY